MKSQLLCAFLIALFPAMSHGKTYNYSFYAADLGDSVLADTVTLDVNRNELVVGHTRQRLSICPISSNMYCFESKALEFAIPKKGVAQLASWQFNGREYMVRETATLQLAGRKVEVLVVTTTRGTREDRFFYSERRGLLGISTIERDPKRAVRAFYLLQERLGFPFGK